MKNSAQLSVAGDQVRFTRQECRTIGCGGLSYDADFCGDCQDQVYAIAAWRMRRDESRKMMRRAARRLENFAYMVAVIGCIAWILFEFRDFIFDCYQLWFGGK